MEIFKVIGIALVAAAVAVVLRSQKPEISMQIAILAGTIIFILMMTKLSAVIELIGTFAQKAGVEAGFLGTIIKITGIAYITEFASGICRDSGESALASKVEFAGKIVIVTLAVPIFGALLTLLMKIMP